MSSRSVSVGFLLARLGGISRVLTISETLLQNSAPEAAFAWISCAFLNTSVTSPLGFLPLWHSKQYLLKSGAMSFSYVSGLPVGAGWAVGAAPKLCMLAAAAR